jgi:hypothetical protein
MKLYILALRALCRCGAALPRGDYPGSSLKAARDVVIVELSVLLVQRWITALLHRRTFFSLQELNRLIEKML